MLTGIDRTFVLSFVLRLPSLINRFVLYVFYKNNEKSLGKYGVGL